MTSQNRAGAGMTARYIRRVRSAAVALAVGLLASIGTQLATGSPIGFIGIPIAGATGWMLALRLDGGASRTIVAILSMAFWCAVLGAYAVALLAATDNLGAAFVVGTLGVLFFGIPAFVLLLVPATAWAIITSWLERRAARR